MSPAVGLRSAALPAKAGFSDHFLFWLLFLLCGVAGCNGWERDQNLPHFETDIWSF
jgi:hypothetical protein